MRRRKRVPESSVEAVHLRSFGRCERCNVKHATQIHHRLPRQMGGTPEAWIHEPDLLAHLCQWCHEWIESNRQEAYTLGWLLPSTMRYRLAFFKAPPPGEGFIRAVRSSLESRQ